jgi:hypothetical protein
MLASLISKTRLFQKREVGLFFGLLFYSCPSLHCTQQTTTTKNQHFFQNQIHKMSMDHKILEQRLITKDSVLAAPSLSKCAVKLSALRSNLSDKVALEAFLREVILFKIESDKACKTFDSYALQKAEYEALENQIKEKTNETREEIDFLREKLRQEKEIRKHRLKVEEFAVDVNKHKSKSYLKRKIADVEESLDATNQNLRQIDIDILARKSQFDALSKALLDLESQLILENDDNDDESDGGDHNEREQRGTDMNVGPEEGQKDTEVADQGNSMQIEEGEQL